MKYLGRLSCRYRKMSEPVIKHELFEYDRKRPFKVYIVNSDNEEKVKVKLLNHWHEELEMVYLADGTSTHYINGECIHVKKGQLIVTNSGFIHSIIPDFQMRKRKAVVIIIKPQFIEENFPDYDSVYFTNEAADATAEMRSVIDKLAESAGQQRDEYHYLYERGLLMELLYYLCRDRTKKKDAVADINILRNIERMKGVIQFIENHYKEHISQENVAEKFYFSKVYFSRYFKKCTGMTFTDYLTLYRLTKAQQDILYSQKSISQVALDNGFSDDRRLIVTFKKRFGTTPLQYRKEYEKNKKETVEFNKR